MQTARRYNRSTSAAPRPRLEAPKTVEASGGARKWSTYQQAVFRDVAQGTGHTVVQARAGSGKTSTIVEAFKHVPAGLSTLMVAFNKSIASELSARAPAGVQVCTLHSFGARVILSAFRGTRLDQYKVDGIAREMHGSEKETARYRSALTRAVSLAKGMLSSTEEEILQIADAFDLEILDSERSDFAADAIVILARCRDTIAMSYDFDDMIWGPVELGLPVKQFDRVFIDETQDLNAAQIKLALAARAKGGRICAVGDDRQSIYQFRGADAQAMPRVIEALRAKVLPLSITYRCARKIVDVAKRIVPDFEAAEGADDGEVIRCSEEQLKKLVAPGDFVLSRANAPLVSMCLALISAGKPATVAGRDIGKGLTTLIDKSGAESIPALTGWIEGWLEGEVKRLEKKRNSEAQISAAEDRAECIHTLAEGAKSVEEVRAKIEALFSDKDDSSRIVLSTTHKAKGLERDRAFVLSKTYRPSKGVEEANLYYVAVTRARKVLYLVE